jgi:hypothetical protein
MVAKKTWMASAIRTNGENTPAASPLEDKDSIEFPCHSRLASPTIENSNRLIAWLRGMNQLRRAIVA